MRLAFVTIAERPDLVGALWPLPGTWPTFMRQDPVSNPLFARLPDEFATGESAEPRTPMAEEIARVRDDGLPADPWLRVHARLGARIVKVCPRSMLITGTVAQWREGTGLWLASSGPHEVPDALAPVHVSIEHDHALYAEPNVWMHHRLSAVPNSEA